MKMGAHRWKRLGVVRATSPPLWIPAFAGMTKGGRIGECESGDMRALSGSSNSIVVPIVHAGGGLHTKI